MTNKITSKDVSGRNCILVGLFSMKEKNIQDKFYTARSIVESHGGTIVGTLVQRRGISRSRKPGGVNKLNSPLSSLTFIGKGKAEELCILAKEQSVDVIIFFE